MNTTTKNTILLRAGQFQLSGIHTAPQGTSRALIIALHGGAATAHTFNDTIPGAMPFVDIAAHLGYTTLALDRPGYGASAQIAAEHTSFDGQVKIMRLALQQAWEEYGAGSTGIFLIGHSIGGMISLCLAASKLDVPLLGVSTHGAGILWQPGSMEMFKSVIKDSPLVTIPAAPRTGREPVWNLESADPQKGRAPMSVIELQGALTWPERLRRIGAEIDVPVQMTIAEYDNIWSPAPEALQELSTLFPSAPFINVQSRRFISHAFNASLATQSFYLQEFAFVEECRVRKVVADA